MRNGSPRSVRFWLVCSVVLLAVLMMVSIHQYQTGFFISPLEGVVVAALFLASSYFLVRSFAARSPRVEDEPLPPAPPQQARSSTGQ